MAEKKCPHCLHQRRFLTKTKNMFLYSEEKESDDDDIDVSSYVKDKKTKLKKYPLNASDLMNHMRDLYKVLTLAIVKFRPNNIIRYLIV